VLEQLVIIVLSAVDRKLLPIEYLTSLIFCLHDRLIIHVQLCD